MVERPTLREVQVFTTSATQCPRGAVRKRQTFLKLRHVRRCRVALEVWVHYCVAFLLSFSRSFTPLPCHFLPFVYSLHMHRLPSPSQEITSFWVSAEIWRFGGITRSVQSLRWLETVEGDPCFLVMSKEADPPLERGGCGGVTTHINCKGRVTWLRRESALKVGRRDDFNNSISSVFSLWPNLETYVVLGAPKVEQPSLWAWSSDKSLHLKIFNLWT